MSIDGSFRLNGVEARDFTPIWVKSFDPGVEAVETTDLDNPVFDDTYAGVDFFRAPTYTFEIVVEGSTPAEVRDRVNQVKKAWRPSASKVGGELCEMEVRLAGGRYVVYGRPRRFACNHARTGLEGYAIIDADFKLMDPLAYRAAWNNRRLDMVPPTMRGLTEPLTEPLSTGGYSHRQGVIEEVGGTAPTPFMIDVTAGPGGPIVDPWVSINGNKYEFDLTVRENRTLRIDSRRGIALNGGTNALSTMKRRTRLKSVRLPNGQVEISFGGVNPALDAHATFWWRPADYTI